MGALTLANMEPGRMTPRSKFYAIKYHWFCSHLKPNKISVEKISKDADILINKRTKGLTQATFENIRKLLGVRTPPTYKCPHGRPCYFLSTNWPTVIYGSKYLLLPLVRNTCNTFSCDRG